VPEVLLGVIQKAPRQLKVWFLHPQSLEPLVLAWEPLVLAWEPLVLAWEPLVLAWEPLVLAWEPPVLARERRREVVSELARHRLAAREVVAVGPRS
jgi:hypothetical protein